MNVVPHPQWGPQDNDLAKQFFATPTWMKIVEMMKAARPSIKSDKIEGAALEGKARQAWEDCIDAFAQITRFDFSEGDVLTQVDTNFNTGSKPHGASP